MGLGDVSDSVIPKPVLVSDGDSATSLTSRYFTPRRCHASARRDRRDRCGDRLRPARHRGQRRDAGRAARATSPCCIPQGRIDVEVELAGTATTPASERAALVRTARKILQGELAPSRLRVLETHSRRQANEQADRPARRRRRRGSAAAPAAMALTPIKTITIVVPTAAGGGNDAMARTIAQKLGPLLGQTVDRRQPRGR